VQDSDREGADLDLAAVLDRLERVLGLGDRVDRDRDAVLEREPPVTGQVVGVGVRLEHARDPHAAALGLHEVGLDARRQDRRARPRPLPRSAIR
jgi:hypothetical protein